MSYKNCVMCKEEFGHNNVFTDAGLRETQISGMCEVCFDSVTYDMYEYIEDLVENYPEELFPVTSVRGCFLAGGAMRTLVDPEDALKDIDLFFETEDALNKTLDYFEANENFKNIFTCPKRELFTYINTEDEVKVQLVAKEFYTPQEAIESLDVTACCAAWDGKSIYKHRRFVSDVMNKRIHLNNIQYPNATMRRINKYSHKGYTLTQDAIRYFVETVNAMELTEDNMEFYVD